MPRDNAQVFSPLKNEANGTKWEDLTLVNGISLRKHLEKGIASKILIPKHKDWNDDLRALQAEQAEETDQAEESSEDEEADLCQGLQL